MQNRKTYIVDMVHEAVYTSVIEVCTDATLQVNLATAIVTCTPETIEKIARIEGVLQVAGEHEFELDYSRDIDTADHELWYLGNASNTLEDGTYKYACTGRGVDVYTVDMGVFSYHDEFQKGPNYDNPSIENIASIITPIESSLAEQPSPPPLNPTRYNGWLIEPEPNNSRVLYLSPFSAFGGYYQIRPSPDSGHGTAVAGCGAGLTCGFAPDARIIACCNIVSSTSVLATFELIIKHHNLKMAIGKARPSVLNLSFGFSNVTPAFYEVVKNAMSNMISVGIIVVTSAGNHGTLLAVNGTEHTPQGLDTVISVGATNRAGNLTSFSNYGVGVNIFSPGRYPKLTRIINQAEMGMQYLGNLELFPRNTYVGTSSGTSFSSPFLQGMIACALEELGLPLFLGTPAERKQQVLDFYQWFYASSYAREWETSQHYEGSLHSPNEFDPDYWFDGWDDDDDGSPHLEMAWSSRIRATGTAIKIPITAGISGAITPFNFSVPDDKVVCNFSRYYTDELLDLDSLVSVGDTLEVKTIDGKYTLEYTGDDSGYANHKYRHKGPKKSGVFAA